ncbi:cytochrome P450 [Mycena crocata]|nr:cytochrome P450 [Mycena crocata]
MLPTLSLPPPAILFAGLLLVAVLHCLYVRDSRNKLPSPPGPPKLPLVGNLFDMPPTLQWEAYSRWSKQYNSDIIHLNLAGTSVVVLTSFEAVEALMERRSSFYSDRGDHPMVSDLMGWDFNFGMRTHRRLFNQAFNIKAVHQYQPQERRGAHRLLAHLLQTPDAFMDHFRQMSGEIIISVVYGIDVLQANDPYVTLAQEALHTFSIACIPGRYLVDSFPILKHVPEWFPGAGFKRQAAVWRKLARAMLEVPFAETQRQMDAGTAPSSFTADCLRTLRDNIDSAHPAYYEEHHVKSTAGTMFIGAAETTVSSLATFVLAMLANPEAQRKAQAEVDSVTGGRYLPTFEDEVSMPYVSAIVKEVLRWKNTTPFGFPHVLTTDDEFQGYRLPAGSLVIGNAWYVLYSAMYPAPHEFKPERWLLNGKLNSAVRNPDVAFGFGRRRCPGRHMATSMVWIGIVSILAGFDIQKAFDENGEVIEPTYEYVSGVICTPVPFKCSIKPRSQERVELIRAAIHDRV